jgi:hypothetical protein
LFISAPRGILTVRATKDTPEEDAASDAGHDPLVKQFLQSFLPEFMQGFYPDVADSAESAPPIPRRSTFRRYNG